MAHSTNSIKYVHNLRLLGRRDSADEVYDDDHDDEILVDDDDDDVNLLLMMKLLWIMMTMNK